MGFNPFKLFFPKKMLGIDIGTASIKLVEISRWGGGRNLDNYGEIQSAALFKESFRSTGKGNYLFSADFVSKAIRAVLDEARIKTTSAIFSIPDFSTFFVSFDLPPLALKELPDAIRFNAPQYIPLPISETTLDWKVISGTPGSKQGLKVLVVAIANQVVQEYQRVAQMAGLELYALEAEALAVTRALVKDRKKIICVLDIGVQSTTVNIIDQGILKKSYSFDFASGNQLTHAISSSLGKEYVEAEEIKKAKGLLSPEKNVNEILYLLVDPLLLEVKKICLEFAQAEGKEVEEIYITGGTANLPGLKEYFAAVFKKKIEVPNCFTDFLYPPILGNSLAEMAPRFSVAVGVALQGLE